MRSVVRHNSGEQVLFLEMIRKLSFDTDKSPLSADALREVTRALRQRIRSISSLSQQELSALARSTFRRDLFKLLEERDLNEGLEKAICNVKSLAVLKRIDAKKNGAWIIDPEIPHPDPEKVFAFNLNANRMGEYRKSVLLRHLRLFTDLRKGTGRVQYDPNSLNHQTQLNRILHIQSNHILKYVRWKRRNPDFSLRAAVRQGQKHRGSSQHKSSSALEATCPQLFISHSWTESADYYHLLRELEAMRYEFVNISIPMVKRLHVGNQSDQLDRRSTRKELTDDQRLKAVLREHINASDVVIVLGKEYMSKGRWIKYELETARALSKPIIIYTPDARSQVPKSLFGRKTMIVDPFSSNLLHALEVSTGLRDDGNPFAILKKLKR